MSSPASAFTKSPRQQRPLSECRQSPADPGGCRGSASCVGHAGLRLHGRFRDRFVAEPSGPVSVIATSSSAHFRCTGRAKTSKRTARGQPFRCRLRQRRRSPSGLRQSRNPGRGRRYRTPGCAACGHSSGPWRANGRGHRTPPTASAPPSRSCAGSSVIARPTPPTSSTSTASATASPAPDRRYPTRAWPPVGALDLRVTFGTRSECRSFH